MARMSAETRRLAIQAELARDAFVTAMRSPVDKRARAAERSAQSTRASRESAVADAGVARKLAEHKRRSRAIKRGRVRMRYRPRLTESTLMLSGDGVVSVAGARVASDARSARMSRNVVDRSDNQRRDSRRFGYRSLTPAHQDVSAEQIASDQQRDLASPARAAARSDREARQRFDRAQRRSG